MADGAKYDYVPYSTTVGHQLVTIKRHRYIENDLFVILE